MQLFKTTASRFFVLSFFQVICKLAVYFLQFWWYNQTIFCICTNIIPLGDILMSTATKPLLEYRRPADCWCCSYCETENNSKEFSCQLCNNPRNDRCLTLKAWNPNLSNNPYGPASSSSRLRGSFNNTPSPPAHSADNPYTNPPHAPVPPAGSYAGSPFDGKYEKKSPNTAPLLIILFAAIIIIVAVAVVFANAAEPAPLEEITDSVCTSENTSASEITQNSIIPKEVSYVL